MRSASPRPGRGGRRGLPDVLRPGRGHPHPLSPGVPALLTGLRAAGLRLAVATSKPEATARRIVAGVGIDEYFALVGGADPAGGRIGKAAVIGSVLHRLALDPRREPVVMVGDRHHDVDGAAAFGIPAVGVAWGYAEPGELRGARLVVPTWTSYCSAVRGGDLVIRRTRGRLTSRARSSEAAAVAREVRGRKSRSTRTRSGTCRVHGHQVQRFTVVVGQHRRQLPARTAERATSSRQQRDPAPAIAARRHERQSLPLTGPRTVTSTGRVGPCRRHRSRRCSARNSTHVRSASSSGRMGAGARRSSAGAA